MYQHERRKEPDEKHVFRVGFKETKMTERFDVIFTGSNRTPQQRFSVG